jgi:MerR family transcriptional regulator, redox-sensitive transcriptional activator SoxR
MTDLLIGELARRAGVSTSSLRFYEKAGLLPPPPRASKRRHYNPQILGRVRIILLAREAGFSIEETRTFLHGYPSGTPPAARWRALAQKKIAELDALLTRVSRMKNILEASFHCECLQLEDCERLVLAGHASDAPAAARRPKPAKHTLQRTAPRKP